MQQHTARLFPLRSFLATRLLNKPPLKRMTLSNYLVWAFGGVFKHQGHALYLGPYRNRLSYLLTAKDGPICLEGQALKDVLVRTETVS
jgi:hypothetical protein